jgi:hypothetical protein
MRFMFLRGKMFWIVMIVSAAAASGCVPETFVDPASLAQAAEVISASGTVERIEDASLSVDGVQLVLNSDTEIRGQIRIDDPVNIFYIESDDGNLAVAVTLDLAEIDPLRSLEKLNDAIEIRGTLQTVAQDFWTVEGIPLRISPQTEFEITFQAGDQVRVLVFLNSDGRFQAQSFSALLAVGGISETFVRISPKVEWSGFVESIALDQWTIQGVVAQVSSETKLTPGLKIGDQVKVHANLNSAGLLVAREIERLSADELDKTGQIEFVGHLISNEGEIWIVDSWEVLLGPETEIGPGIGLGELVKVEGVLTLESKVQAREIDLFETVNDADDVDEFDNDDETDDLEEIDEIEFFGVIESIPAEYWNVHGLTLRVSIDTEVDFGLLVGDLVKVEAALDDEGRLVALEIYRPRDQADAERSSGMIEFTGNVISIEDGVWMVDGWMLLINPGTEVQGQFAPGDLVKIEARIEGDGSLTALEIKSAIDAGHAGDEGSSADDSDLDPVDGDDDFKGDHESRDDSGDHDSVDRDDNDEDDDEDDDDEDDDAD